MAKSWKHVNNTQGHPNQEPYTDKDQYQQVTITGLEENFDMMR